MPTILCVDDQPVGLAIRKQLLESKGYDVLIATDGERAIALTKQQTVDLVVLDYRLPGMNGEEIATILKTENPRLPVVLLTGYPGDIPERLIARVDGFVEKGNSATVLLSAIENAMRVSRERRAQGARPEGRRDTA